jgi:hypothetical protein
MEHIRVFTQAMQGIKPALLLLGTLLLVLIGACLAVLYYQDFILWDFVRYFSATVGLFFFLAVLYFVLRLIFKEELK